MKFDLRSELAVARQALRESYLQKPNPRLLLRKHAQLIDRMVKSVWTQTGEALGRISNAESFFKAKKLEQEQRHAKHQDSPYSLEPNLKEAPGGLRDLQVIQWIARASGIGRHWSDLVAHGLIERDEARHLA